MLDCGIHPGPKRCRHRLNWSPSSLTLPSRPLWSFTLVPVLKAGHETILQGHLQVIFNITVYKNNESGHQAPLDVLFTHRRLQQTNLPVKAFSSLL